MTPVNTLPAADADIDDILGFLERNAGPRVAASYARRFAAVLRQLSEFPKSGAPRGKLGVEVRVLPEYPYVFIYRVEPDRVMVLRVVDGRRRITRRLVEGRD